MSAAHCIRCRRELQDVAAADVAAHATALCRQLAERAELATLLDGALLRGAAACRDLGVEATLRSVRMYAVAWLVGELDRRIDARRRADHNERERARYLYQEELPWRAELLRMADRIEVLARARGAPPSLADVARVLRAEVHRR